MKIVKLVLYMLLFAGFLAIRHRKNRKQYGINTGPLSLNSSYDNSNMNTLDLNHFGHDHSVAEIYNGRTIPGYQPYNNNFINGQSGMPVQSGVHGGPHMMFLQTKSKNKSLRNKKALNKKKALRKHKHKA